MINLSVYVDHHGRFSAPRYAIDYFTGKEMGCYLCNLNQIPDKDSKDFEAKVLPLFEDSNILYIWERVYKLEKYQRKESYDLDSFINDNTLKSRTEKVVTVEKPFEMVYSIDSDSFQLFYPLDKGEVAKNFISKIDDIYKEYKSNSQIVEEEPCIELVIQSDNELYTRSYRIKPVEFDVKDNYESSFHPIDEKIKAFCAEENSNGIVLLHGMMGSGKTYYIRHLINHLHTLKKDIIYFPPNMVEYISEPIFITFMQENSGKILILEDAEKVLKKRELSQNTNAASNILNISDGLLGDALKLKIIATFNCERKHIDPALLRKGRLITEYKFSKLSVEKSTEVARRLQLRKYRKGSYTLAELFNWGK